MPKGRSIRQDDITSEKLQVKATKDMNRDMLNAMTGEDGPLPSGALPEVKAATAAGQQNLLKALDEDKGKVEKSAKPKKRIQPPESVEPKTVLQSGHPVCFSSFNAEAVAQITNQLSTSV